VVSRLMKYFLAAIGGATAIMLLFYFADQGVLGMAAKYADDEPKLIKFMSDMGYPKTGEWCGEFAASVIKRAGGTPPSGAAIASNWRGYGAPDAMPHVGDVAVADRGVPTGATGSHVGFVTDVDLKNGTFTLESGNSSNIYTTRKIGCFSFHTPPNNVLSALIGNGVPSETAIGNALTGLPLSRASIGVYAFVPAISSPDPDDCLDTDNYDEIQNDDSLERIRAPANSFDGERICVLHLPASDAPRFCPYARITRESTMYRAHRRCTATTAMATISRRAFRSLPPLSRLCQQGHA
jgi:CHAP domain